MASALRYTAITSLDGYVADTEGDFGWAEPARRFVEVWRGVDEVGFSSTLEEVATARATLERRFEGGTVYLRYRVERG